MEDKLKKFVKENREAFDSKIPSPEIWNRVKSQIESPKKERKISLNWIWSAAAVILVLFTVGLLWQRNQGLEDVLSDGYIVEADTEREGSIQPFVESPVEPKTETATIHIEARPDRTRLRKQDKTMAVETREEGEDLVSKTAEMLAMLNDANSAIKRMEGVLQAGEFEVLPSGIMEQLHHIVNHDPNSNVRMVALELLMVHTPMSEWDERIQDVFVQQDDPILQLELMHVMATVDSIGINPATADKLYEITEDPFAIDLVKEQAYAVLMKNW